MTNKAQSSLEYVFIIFITVAALLAAGVYIKRAAEGRLRRDAEQLNGSAYSPKATSGTYVMTSTVTESSDYKDKTSTNIVHVETGVAKDETILPLSAEPERD
jgi:uncharacterized protein (UPF0333 family)